MRSTRRILSLVTPRKLVLPVSFPVRTLHMSAPRLMPVRGPDGRSRLWTDEELLAAERRGFENAGGKWSGSSSPRGEYTAEELKAALEKGLEHADQYVGAAIRGVWDKSFSEGKIVGASEEKVVAERRIQEERVLQENRARTQIDEVRRTSFAKGLEANPDFVRAKLEGRAEGEKIGCEEGERTARKSLQDREERVRQAEVKAEKKIQHAKESAVSEYIHNKKLSTRFNNWKNNVSPRWEQKIATENINQQPIASASKRSLKKIIGEIPITLHTVEVHRESKHKPLHFCYNQKVSSSYRSHFIIAYVFPPQITADSYDIDKIRLKDLPNSMILGDICNGYQYSGSSYKRATPIPAYMAFPCVVLSISLFFFGMLVQTGQRRYDQYLHGETDEQYKTKKSIEKVCDKLEKSDPKYYGAIAFTPLEEEKLQKCKQGCQSIKPFHERMRHEMEARRSSGHGDPSLFGPRQLDSVYDDTVKIVPLLHADRDLADSILSRIESEKEVIELKRAEKERASKERKYQEIKNTGLRK